jgi:hypothetical protein
MMRQLNLLTLLLATLLLATGCTNSYWTSLLKTSEIQGAVVTKGKISWKAEVNDEGNTVYLATKTAPVLSVSLIPGSSPVDLEAAVVEYFSPQGEGGKPAYVNVDDAAMPYRARLLAETPSELVLGQIITRQLVDATNPSNGTRISDIDVEAVVTFQGFNQFRDRVTWKISVPITIVAE